MLEVKYFYLLEKTYSVPEGQGSIALCSDQFPASLDALLEPSCCPLLLLFSPLPPPPLMLLTRMLVSSAPSLHFEWTVL